jgi:diguanylate cyclase
VTRPSLPRRGLAAGCSALVVLAWAALLVHSVTADAGAVSQALLCLVTVSSALACWVRVATVRAERAVWSLFALGLSGYGGGFLVLFYVSMGDGAGPWGLNRSDCASLLLYPSVYAALLLLTRSRMAVWHAGALLDGAVVVLACGSVAVTWAVKAYPSLVAGGMVQTVYALAYPVGGATLLLLTVAGLAVTRWRTDAVWLLLLVGFAVMTYGDAVYGSQSAAGTFRFGTPLDAAYTAGPVLVALAAWRRPGAAGPARATSLAGMAVPFAAALAALGVLVYRDPMVPALSVGLAAVAVVVAIARTGLFVRQEHLLVERTREARTDELTGLAHRRVLLAQLARLADGPGEGVLVLVDLDHFKEVNDTLGHTAGDQVLIEVAETLVRAAPEGLVARLGGDEFAVLLSGDLDEALVVAARLRAAVGGTMVLEGCRVTVGATVGLAASAADPSWAAQGSGELLRRADVALYRAKRSGSGTEVWRPEFDEGMRERLNLVSDLRAGLRADDQVVVHFQPKCDPSTQEVVGFEALVRWHHPTLGLVPPMSFVPAAEAAGILPLLTARVLDLSLGHVAALGRRGHRLPVAVNVGAPDLLDAGFAASVGRALARHGVPPHLLRVEVTETVVMTDPARVTRTLEDLRAMGVALSLDDYGTGLSSLSYLRTLPVDELKVDRSFVSRLTDDPASSLIVASTIALAHGLGLTVVAEGVEDEATLDALVAAGCDVVQGYLLGRPVPVDELRLPAGVLVPQPREPQAGPAPVV